MIITVVQFKLPEPVTRDQAKDIFLGTASKYREVEGLIRKNYILSEDGTVAGGVYVWKFREHAERLYNDQWRAFVTEKYGSEPSVQYFESPVLVDNVAGKIIQDP
jgi:hypothetical protein